MKSAQWSFSALRRVKTYLRSSISGERLNDVLLLNVHIEQANSLDLINIAYNLVFANARRHDYFESLNWIEFFWFCLIILSYCSVHVYVHFNLQLPYKFFLIFELPYKFFLIFESFYEFM